MRAEGSVRVPYFIDFQNNQQNCLENFGESIHYIKFSCYRPDDCALSITRVYKKEN